MKRFFQFLLAVLVGWLIYDSILIVNETQQGVVTVFGRIDEPVRQPGLHFKFPRPISIAYKVDRRMQVLDGLTQELITEDQKNVLVDSRVLYRITDPILYITAVRTVEKARERLSDLHFSASGIVISSKSRDAFVSLGLEREELHRISGEILELVRDTALNEYGIDVLDLSIVEYTLPVENRPSVIQRMISERARIAARYRSEGEEQALRIEALALFEHDKIMAEAHAEATRIVGEAEATAMENLAVAYRQDPEFYKFIRALDSYDTIIDQNTTLMLPSDNELFRYLDSNQIPTLEIPQELQAAQ